MRLWRSDVTEEDFFDLAREAEVWSGAMIGMVLLTVAILTATSVFKPLGAAFRSLPDKSVIYIVWATWFVSYIAAKKLRQRRAKDALFSANKMKRWLERRRRGFKVILIPSIGLSALLFGVLGAIRSVPGSDAVMTVALSAVRGIVLAGIFAALYWWDNLDSEREYRRKHPDSG